MTAIEAARMAYHRHIFLSHGCHRRPCGEAHRLYAYYVGTAR